MACARPPQGRYRYEAPHAEASTATAIAPRDLRELVARAYHHLDLQSETLADQAPAALRELCRGDVARQHDVAALQIRAHILEARAAQQLAQLRHRDAVVGTQVDAAQE